MAHAQLTGLLQLGFLPAQFGDPEDWLQPSGLPLRSIEQAAAQIRATMGAEAYDAVTGDQLTLLQEAEEYLAGARLWLRLEVYERSTATLNRSGREAETISSRLIRNANEYEDMCWSRLGDLGVARSLGFATGYVATDSLSNEVTTA